MSAAVTKPKMWEWIWNTAVNRSWKTLKRVLAKA